MRTWILGSAMIISQTISPDMGYPIAISLLAMFLLIAGAFMDFSDFFGGK